MVDLPQHLQHSRHVARLSVMHGVNKAGSQYGSREMLRCARHRGGTCCLHAVWLITLTAAVPKLWFANPIGVNLPGVAWQFAWGRLIYIN